LCVVVFDTGDCAVQCSTCSAPAHMFLVCLLCKHVAIWVSPSTCWVRVAKVCAVLPLLLVSNGSEAHSELRSPSVECNCQVLQGNPSNQSSASSACICLSQRCPRRAAWEIPAYGSTILRTNARGPGPVGGGAAMPMRNACAQLLNTTIHTATSLAAATHMDMLLCTCTLSARTAQHAELSVSQSADRQCSCSSEGVTIALSGLSGHNCFDAREYF
jgi:hypothetical protein